MKRGTEDLDFFIGDEALAAANGPGTWICRGIGRNADGGQDTAYIILFDMDRLRIGYLVSVSTYDALLMLVGPYGKVLV